MTRVGLEHDCVALAKLRPTLDDDTSDDEGDSFFKQERRADGVTTPALPGPAHGELALHHSNIAI